ncbi:MAG: hypothetical protein O3B37_04205 [Proteobacteria bacterium]|nr:hypothetical protein [Pseudomonadota bacterium]
MSSKKAVSRTELVEILWRGRYPIVVPTYARDYVAPLFLLLPCTFLGLWILLQDNPSLNQFRGWLLFLGGGGFAAFILASLVKPGWRQMVIHEDHAQTPFRKISFKDVELFEGGYPVRIRYRNRSPLSRLRNTFRFASSLKSRYVVGGYGAAHLLNRALDDYRARQIINSSNLPD